MIIDEFATGREGLFDCHRHPEAIPSVYGDFVVELYTEMDVPPSAAMVVAANALVTRFRLDEAVVCDLIYREYLTVCTDPDWAGWLDDVGVERGRTIAEIGRYLDARTLVVNDDLSACVYVSPQWDTEHGLYFEYTPQGWARAN